MASFMAPLSNYTYAVLRIVTGLLFCFTAHKNCWGGRCRTDGWYSAIRHVHRVGRSN